MLLVSVQFDLKFLGLCTYPLFPPKPLLFTGAPKTRGGKVKPSSRRHRDDEQEEIMPTRTTKRQRDAAAGARGPQKSMLDIKKGQFLEVRGANPYLLPRNARQCPNPYFHHVN